tara:strand:- start:2943 stop:3824 length:882 start_codon:yes stop_codon:yes gene_type:complete
MSINEKIDLRPYVDIFPTSGSVKLNHCKEGKSNQAFFLTRKEDGYVLGHCFHCGGSGSYSSTNDFYQFKTQKFRGRRVEKSSSGGGDADSFATWGLPQLQDWDNGQVDRAGFAGIPREFRHWWLSAGCNVEDYERLGVAYLNGMVVVPLYRDGLVTNVAARTKKDNDLPKWLTLGHKTHGFMTTKTSLLNFLVICEDVISGIRLSRYCTALPLLGTSLNDTHFSDIVNWANEHREKHQVLVWLDNDSPLVVQKAKRICSRLQNHANTSIVLNEVEAKHFIHDKKLRDFTWKQI